MIATVSSTRNAAVKDVKQLASDPLDVVIDFTGKRIKEGEMAGKDGDLVPSKEGAGGEVLYPAKAAHSWEDFNEAFLRLDSLDVKNNNLAELAKAYLRTDKDKDEYRVVRTFAWHGHQGQEPSSIMLVGTTRHHAASRDLAARVVYEAEPSALMVQLCRERLGRHLVMPTEHAACVADYATSFKATNVDKTNPAFAFIESWYQQLENMKKWMSDGAYAAAVDEFAYTSTGSLPKVVCLGDVPASRLEQIRLEHGNDTLKTVPFQMSRGKQLARGLISMAKMGHKTIVGVVQEDMLAPVTTWLERSGARLVAVADRSALESGRESIAGDIMLARKSRPPKFDMTYLADNVLGLGQKRLGSFINEDGLQAIQGKKDRLRRTTRVMDLIEHVEKDAAPWHIADLSITARVVPGPEALLNQRHKGLHVWEYLEIPQHYLRDVGMEEHSKALWQNMLSNGEALETKDPKDLHLWLTGKEQEEEEDDDGVEAFDAEELRQQIKDEEAGVSGVASAKTVF